MLGFTDGDDEQTALPDREVAVDDEQDDDQILVPSSTQAGRTDRPLALAVLVAALVALAALVVLAAAGALGWRPGDRWYRARRERVRT